MTIEVINASLELIEVDITAAVYEEFFARCPDALSVMGHSDEHMQGRMLEQVVGLLLSDEHFDPDGYLDWELDNHLVGYQVQGSMYQPFFDALLSVVKTSIGAEFTPAMTQAWEARIATIMQHVLANPAASR